MKHIFYLIFALLDLVSWSQAPLSIPYQCVLRNVDGSVMANTALTMTFKIHEVAATGNVVYQETHSLNSNGQGLVVCAVGSGTAVQGTFAGIQWGSGAKFMHVLMNTGSGEIDLGTQQMMSVPFALYSNGVSVNVSTTGDTLSIGGNHVIVPGISVANLVYGCTDIAACNYNSSANQNDNSCLYTGATCDDGNANTTNDLINGGCVCAGTPTSGSGTGAQLLPGNATCANEYISVTDCAGQDSLFYNDRYYTLVEIGGQCWFAENLATSIYSNGDFIVGDSSDGWWVDIVEGRYTVYADLFSNDLTYGKLYNWYAVSDVRGLCPTGWHVPSDCDWMNLEKYLGVEANEIESYAYRGESAQVGSILKYPLTWFDGDGAVGINSVGFSGLAGGFKQGAGYSMSMGYGVHFWTSSEFTSTNAIYRSLSYNLDGIHRGDYGWKPNGFSVRCIKD